MTEKQLEDKLVSEVKKQGGIAYKFVSPGRAGVPDRLVILPGGCYGFVEVKKPGSGVLSRLQVHEINRLKILGCKCFILDEPAKIRIIIQEIKS